MDGSFASSIIGVSFVGEPPRRSVQLPVELTPLMHRRLINWCRQTATELDVPGLARSDVLEALIEQLVHDDRASAAVRDRLAARIRREQGAEPPAPRPPREDSE